MIKILAISGSLRSSSANTNILRDQRKLRIPITIALTEDPTGTIKIFPSLVQAELIPEGGLKLAANRIKPATNIKKASEQNKPTAPSIINNRLRFFILAYRFPLLLFTEK
jgi:hypothetical protein